MRCGVFDAFRTGEFLCVFAFVPEVFLGVPGVEDVEDWFGVAFPAVGLDWVVECIALFVY